MSDTVPQPGGKPGAAQSGAAKPGIKVGGLGPAAQKLQNLREKAAQGKSGAKPTPTAPAASFKAKTLAGTKKTSFQRKAV